MKNRIFITWSCTSEIALKAKQILENKCSNKSLISGNGTNNSKYAFRWGYCNTAN